MTDGENRELAAICAREANGPLRNYAALSDVLRMLALLKHPGTYLDVDSRIEVGSVGEVKAPAGLLLNVDGGIGNNFLASSGHSDIIRTYLRQVIEKYRHGDASPSNQLLKQIPGLLRAHGTQPADVTWDLKRRPGVKATLLPIDRRGLTMQATGPGAVEEAVLDALRGLRDPLELVTAKDLEIEGCADGLDWVLPDRGHRGERP
jgi:hypothetical protein